MAGERQAARTKVGSRTMIRESEFKRVIRDGQRWRAGSGRDGVCRTFSVAIWKRERANVLQHAQPPWNGYSAILSEITVRQERLRMSRALQYQSGGSKLRARAGRPLSGRSNPKSRP